VKSVNFNPDLCAACQTTDCLMKCQYIDFKDIGEAKQERIRINENKDSRVLHECLTCYACQEYCPNGNNPFYFLVERQEKMGLLPSPRPIVTEQLRMMDFKNRIHQEKMTSPIINMCTFPMLTACIRGSLFEGASIFVGTDIFCNIMWLHFAKNSVIRERLPRAINNIMKYYLADSDTKEVICFHDECYGTYTNLAKAYDIDVPFKPIHLFDYINNRLDELSEKIKPLNAVIAYQRPCSNRLIPETDIILDKIFHKISAKRLTRTYDRENALCCGGVTRAHQKDDLADDLMYRNIEDMKAIGAQYCVFNCPFCMATMGQEVTENGIMPVLVSDLVQIALGE